MTHIQWTKRTWNPIAGCSIVSKGCTNCYAMKMAARLQAMAQPGTEHYAGTTMASNGGPVWTGKIGLASDAAFLKPLHWKKPAMIFVNSMSDLFHQAVPDSVIDRVFAVMALCPQHTFQVLTKRPERMRDYMTDPSTYSRILESAGPLRIKWPKLGSVPISDTRHTAFWPQLWLGVSIEDQATADARIPLLLDTPAAIRFVSAEPLLGAVDLRRLALPESWPRCECEGTSPTINAFDASIYCAGCCEGPESMDFGRLDWVICGGENGPRPMHPDWARSLRDQCEDAEAPFFFKQWGTWAPEIDRERDDPDWRKDYSNAFADGGKTKWLNLAGGSGFHGERFHVMRRTTKKAAGDLLDGVQHHAWPAVRS